MSKITRRAFLRVAGISAAALTLAACGGNSGSSSPAAGGNNAAGNDGSALSGDGYDPSVDYAALAGTTVRIAASPTPHAEILRDAVKPILEAAGITLDVVEYDDYILPNNVVEEGECYANYFQHTPYLDSFNTENGTHLVSAVSVHYEPYALYPGKTAAIEDLPTGAQIAVPNDPSNEARALQLLNAAGLLTLDENAGLLATKLDIVENPLDIDVVEMEAAQLPLHLESVDMAVINGNYAKQADLTPAADGLYVEASDGLFAQTYANILCVHEDNLNTDLTRALVAAITSEAVRDYISSTYSDGSVLAIF